MKEIYLDNAASAKLRLDPNKLTYVFGNPNSTHAVGRAAKAKLEEAREKLSNYFNVNPHGVIFTSTATEANNLFCNSFVKVISTVSEHPSISQCKNVDQKIQLTSSGEILIEEESSNTQENFATSIIHLNNENGVIVDLKNFQQINGIKHSDCSQSPIWLNIKDIFRYVNAITISSHKCGGPFGSAALIIDETLLEKKSIQAQLLGGGQEYQHRAGTQNVESIIGFVDSFLTSQNQVEQSILNAKLFEQTLLHILKENNLDFEYIAKDAYKSPSIMCLWFKNCSSQELQTLLDFNQVYISLGSACKSGAVEESKILKSMGYPKIASKETVRISFGWDTKIEEVQAAAEIIVECVNKLVVKR